MRNVEPSSTVPMLFKMLEARLTYPVEQSMKASDSVNFEFQTTQLDMCVEHDALDECCIKWRT